MKQKKMSLANIQGKLSRAEMKKIMAGSAGACDTTWSWCDPTYQCFFSDGVQGKCVRNSDNTKCYCVGAS